MEETEVNTSQSIVSTNSIEGGHMMDALAEGRWNGQQSELEESRRKYPGINGKDSPETLLLIEKHKKSDEERSEVIGRAISRGNESMKTSAAPSVTTTAPPSEAFATQSQTTPGFKKITTENFVTEVQDADLYILVTGAKSAYGDVMVNKLYTYFTQVLQRNVHKMFISSEEVPTTYLKSQGTDQAAPPPSTIIGKSDILKEDNQEGIIAYYESTFEVLVNRGKNEGSYDKVNLIVHAAPQGDIDMNAAILFNAYKGTNVLVCSKEDVDAMLRERASLLDKEKKFTKAKKDPAITNASVKNIVEGAQDYDQLLYLLENEVKEQDQGKVKKIISEMKGKKVVNVKRGKSSKATDIKKYKDILDSISKTEVVDEEIKKGQDNIQKYCDAIDFNYNKETFSKKLLENHIKELNEKLDNFYLEAGTSITDEEKKQIIDSLKKSIEDIPGKVDKVIGENKTGLKELNEGLVKAGTELTKQLEDIFKKLETPNEGDEQKFREFRLKIKENNLIFDRYTKAINEKTIILKINEEIKEKTVVKGFIEAQAAFQQNTNDLDKKLDEYNKRDDALSKAMYKYLVEFKIKELEKEDGDDTFVEFDAVEYKFNMEIANTDTIIKIPRIAAIIWEKSPGLIIFTQVLTGIALCFNDIFTLMKECITNPSKDSLKNYLDEFVKFKKSVKNIDAILQGGSVFGFGDEPNKYIKELIEKRYPISSPPLSTSEFFKNILDFMNKFTYILTFISNVDEDLDELATSETVLKQLTSNSDTTPEFEYSATNIRVMRAYIYQATKELYGEVDRSLIRAFKVLDEIPGDIKSVKEMFSMKKFTESFSGMEGLRKEIRDAGEGDEKHFYKRMFNKYLELYDIAHDTDLIDFMNRMKLMGDPTNNLDIKFKNIYVPAEGEAGSIINTLKAARDELIKIGRTDFEDYNRATGFEHDRTIWVERDHIPNYLHHILDYIAHKVANTGVQAVEQGVQPVSIKGKGAIQLMALYLTHCKNINLIKYIKGEPQVPEGFKEFLEIFPGGKEVTKEPIYLNLALLLVAVTQGYKVEFDKTLTVTPPNPKVDNAKINKHFTVDLKPQNAKDINGLITHNLYIYYWNFVQRIQNTVLFKSATLGISHLTEMNVYKQPWKYIVPHYFFEQVVTSPPNSLEQKIKEIWEKYSKSISYDIFTSEVLDLLLNKVKEDFKDRLIDIRNYPMISIVIGLKNYYKNNLIESVGDLHKKKVSTEGFSKPILEIGKTASKKINDYFKDLGKKVGFSTEPVLVGLEESLRELYKIYTSNLTFKSKALQRKFANDFFLYYVFLDDTKVKDKALVENFSILFRNNMNELIGDLKKLEVDVTKGTHDKDIALIQKMYQEYSKNNVKKEAGRKDLDAILQDSSKYYELYNKKDGKFKKLVKKAVEKFKKDPGVSDYFKLLGAVCPRLKIELFMKSVLGDDVKFDKLKEEKAKDTEDMFEDEDEAGPEAGPVAGPEAVPVAGPAAVPVPVAEARDGPAPVAGDEAGTAGKDDKKGGGWLKTLLGWDPIPDNKAILFDQNKNLLNKVDVVIKKDKDIKEPTKRLFLEGSKPLNLDGNTLLNTYKHIFGGQDMNYVNKLIGSGSTGGLNSIQKLFGNENNAKLIINDIGNMLGAAAETAAQQLPQEIVKNEIEEKDEIADEAKMVGEARKQLRVQEAARNQNRKEDYLQAAVDGFGPTNRASDNGNGPGDRSNGTGNSGDGDGNGRCGNSPQDKAMDMVKKMSEEAKYKMETRLKEHLDFIEDFIKFMEDKKTNWLKDVQSIVDREYGPLIDQVKGYQNQTEEAIKKRIRTAIGVFYHKFIKVLNVKAMNYYLFIKNFYVKDARRKVKEINAYLFKYDNLDEESQALIPKGYYGIAKRFGELNEKFDKVNTEYYSELAKLVDVYAGPGNFLILDDDARIKLTQSVDEVSEKIGKYKQKLKSYYRLNYSMADVLLDTQFVVLYVIKLVRIGFAYIALFMATKIFTPIYEDTVYDKKENPPPLTKFLLIFFAFDMALNVFILTVLFLLKFLFKTDDNAFAVDKYLFYKYFIDYFISMVFLLAIAYFLAGVVQSKKYFKYKYEGLRAVRAYQDIVYSVAIPVFLFPYFLIF